MRVDLIISLDEFFLFLFFFGGGGGGGGGLYLNLTSTQDGVSINFYLTSTGHHTF